MKASIELFSFDKEMTDQQRDYCRRAINCFEMHGITARLVIKKKKKKKHLKLSKIA